MATIYCAGQSFGSDENDGLRRRNIKAAATTHILAHQHIVNADHIIARILKPGQIIAIEMPRHLSLLCPLHPADFVIVPFAAMRATEICRFALLSFVKNVFFVEHITYFKPSVSPMPRKY